MTIPTGESLAAIIDGQHRLFSFAHCASDRMGMSLLCSIYFDLPKPFQANLFATINSTQKRVDRSLTFELFGYNILDEPESMWGPDKLAVFLARKLNTDPSSPIRGRIIIAARVDTEDSNDQPVDDWKVSMATHWCPN